MPRVHLTFFLPEDADEYRIAYKAGDYHDVLMQMSELFRKKYKHEPYPSDAAGLEFEQLKDSFFELLKEYEIEA